MVLLFEIFLLKTKIKREETETETMPNLKETKK
jgi:hypothetical protein